MFGDKAAEPAVKRLYINKEVRQERLSEIEHDLERVNEGIQYKVKRRSMAESTKNYKLCEELTEQIRESEREVTKLKLEVNIYRTKEKKSLSYQKHFSASSSESESCPPVPRRPRLSSDSGGSTEILRRSFSSSPSPSLFSEYGAESPFEPIQPSQALSESIDLTECSPCSDDVSEIASPSVLFSSQGNHHHRSPSMYTSSPNSPLLTDENSVVSPNSSQLVSSPGISSLDSQSQIVLQIQPTLSDQVPNALDSLSSNPHENFQ